MKYLDGISAHCFLLFSGTACLLPHSCKHIPSSLFLLWCHLARGLDWEGKGHEGVTCTTHPVDQLQLQHLWLFSQPVVKTQQQKNQPCCSSCVSDIDVIKFLGNSFRYVKYLPTSLIHYFSAGLLARVNAI